MGGMLDGDTDLGGGLHWIIIILVIIFTLLLSSCTQDSRNLDELLIRAKTYKEREICFIVPDNYYDHLAGSYCLYYNTPTSVHKKEILQRPSNISPEVDPSYFEGAWDK